MRHAELRVQSAWLYGIIVGLSIREALSGTIPQIISPKHDVAGWVIMLAVVRLVIFLVTIIRFYLGSVSYFSEIHVEPQSFYGMDFLTGTVHFVMFFGWATTLSDLRHREASGVSHFGALGAAILLYDIVWLAVSWKSPNRKDVMPWTIINAATTCLCALVFFPHWWHLDAVFKEQAALIVVGTVGLIDIAGILSDRRYIEETIESAFRKFAGVFSSNKKQPEITFPEPPTVVR
jgi:hypothetical protein